MSAEKGYIYPLKLVPVFKTAIWGGERLKEAYGKSFDGERLAETWELSSRTREDSAMIENGEKAGVLLCDYFSDYGSVLIGKKHTGDRFPLLIKWIDARDKLSVQVHPADAYAKVNENDLGKTELWYIAEAKEGARLVYGLSDGADKKTLAEALQRGEVESVLKEIPVRAGDAVFIPAGLLHAIGEGIVIAEIQQSSDVTYRFFDYNRRDKEGNLRPLHVAKAMDVVHPFTEEEIDALRYARATAEEKDDPSVLSVNPYFSARTLDVDGKRELFVGEDSFLHILCVSGEGSIRYLDEDYPFAQGDGYLLPATLGEITVFGKARLLLSGI